MSKSELHVTVDIGSRHHRVAVGDAQGQLLDEFDMEHSAVGLSGSFSRIHDGARSAIRHGERINCS